MWDVPRVADPGSGGKNEALLKGGAALDQQLLRQIQGQAGGLGPSPEWLPLR